MTTHGRPEQGSRLLSVDALRGFTMFWILGGDHQFDALLNLDGPAWLTPLAAQLHHVGWAGLRFYDLIFPLLLFIIGVSAVLSIDRIVATQGRAAAVRRILVRGLTLWLLGVFYDGGIAAWRDENLLCGVLQRAGVCYAAAGLLHLALGSRALAATFGGLLLGYWVLLTFVPAPGEGAPSFERMHNWSDIVDTMLPPYYDRDPEGSVSTLGAICSALLGVLAGRRLASPTGGRAGQARELAIDGAGMLASGLLIAVSCPIVKRIWTPSYVLVTGGISLGLLAAFVAMIDVRGRVRWATPFLWVGANPLALYLASNLADPQAVARRALGGDVERALGGAGPLLVMAAGMALMLAAARWLYARRIFIRV